MVSTRIEPLPNFKRIFILRTCGTNKTMIAKLKSPYVDRLNRPYATGDDKKRKVAEAFEALNSFIRRYGGAVTSPPGKVLRVEVSKGSPLPAKLAELGYNVAACGTVTRIVGADYVS